MSDDLTTEELIDDIERQAVGDLTDPEETKRQLTVGLESLNILNDVRRTIEVEGVSQTDVNTVKGVVDKLRNNGFDDELRTSLEDYNINHFTTNRTMINKRVSCEGIGSVIVNLIKKLIDKLLKMVNTVILKFRQLKNNDNITIRTYESANKKITEVREFIDKLKPYSNPVAADIEAETRTFIKNYYANNGKIPNTTVGDYAKFNVDSARTMRDIVTVVNEFTQKAADTAVDLREFLLGHDDSFDLDLNLETRLDNVKVLMNLVIAPRSTKNELKDDELNLVYNRIFSKTTFAPIALIEAPLTRLIRFSRELNKIKSYEIEFEDPADQDAVTKTIQLMSDCLTTSEDGVKLLEHFNQVQKIAVDVTLKTLNKCSTMHYNYVVENAMTDAVRDRVQGWYDNTVKRIKSFGPI